MIGLGGASVPIALRPPRSELSVMGGLRVAGSIGVSAGSIVIDPNGQSIPLIDPSVCRALMGLPLAVSITFYIN